MNLQQLLILGRVVRPPKIFEVNNKQVANVDICVTETINKNTSDEREQFNYYYCILDGKNLKNIDIIQRNDLMMVDGTPEAEAWLTNDGEAKANIIVNVQRWRVIK